MLLRFKQDKSLTTEDNFDVNINLHYFRSVTFIMTVSLKLVKLL